MRGYFNPSLIMLLTSSMTITNTAGIHRGDVTHHQDQSMLSVSLRIRNMRNNTIGKPIPDADLEFVIVD
jgi:hypothetical protein